MFKKDLFHFGSVMFNKRVLAPINRNECDYNFEHIGICYVKKDQ